jgi:hypothetical protein
MRRIFGLVAAGVALLAAGTADAESDKFPIAVGGKTVTAYLPPPVAYSAASRRAGWR